MSQLLQKQRLVFIFNKFKSNDVIFITAFDDVYGFGTNTSGRLGLGHSEVVPNPVIIRELCGKRVIKIEFGNDFMVALTEALDVYTCGYDNYGYLGNGQNDKTYRKPMKILIKGGKLVTDIMCCVYSTYLLTESKEVYRFGYLQNRSTVLWPTVVHFKNNDKIDAISCGENHCMALTEDGKVYSWGLNDSSKDPKLSSGRLLSVKQISCGDNHCLLLTSDGKVYAFGYNDCGQLGTGDTNRQMTPNLIENIVEFVAIFATKQMSMALTDDNFAYIWGESRNIKFINCPLIAQMHSFEEAVNVFSPNTFSYKTVSSKELFDKKRLNRMMQTMTKAFNNPQNSDFKFKLKLKDSEEFDYIFVRKWIVEENCEYIKNCLADYPSDEIQINNYSYEAYYLFLRCLYTDSIDTKDMELMMEVMKISNQYKDEKMKINCIESIKRLISLQNVCSFYSFALQYKYKEIEEFCFEFMVKNVESVTRSQDYKRMNSNDAKNFLTKFSQLNETIDE